MLRPFATCAALAAVVALSSDCVTDAKPIVLRCPTTADSVTFFADGSCATAGGTIIVATVPGYCALTLTTVCPDQAGCEPLLPINGTFTGDASQTNYSITQGNWTLDGMTPDPQADPSSTLCTAYAGTHGNEVTVDCTINSCTSSGEDTGFTCTTNSCVMHLTAEPDGGVDSGEPDFDGGTDSGEDSGERADSGEHVDSGEKDSGAKDAGLRD
jgi:hypothetical protein